MQLIPLTKRANESKLPDVEIVDLRQELAIGNKTMISTKLHTEIEKNLKDKKQTILFLNRRGFSTFVMCRDCGYTSKCNNCNITLTYHLHSDKLKCHYCGYESKNHTLCPICNSKNIRHFGAGTQRLEKEIKNMFPEASTIRMDIDTTTKKNSHEEILNKFKNENIDILIGTQMVVKGHHFPNVTLVGVIAADASLNIEDYRAGERTFQILTQVAGRAGRENLDGKVIIQTYTPDNLSINYAKQHDYDLLYNSEINLRKQLKYPPFCDIILIGISSTDEKEVKDLSNMVFDYLKQNIEKDNLKAKAFSAVPAPISKIKNKYRWRIIIKCYFDDNIINLINNMLIEYENLKLKNSRVIIDVNPNNLM